MWTAHTYWVFPEGQDHPSQAIVSEDDPQHIIALASEEQVSIRSVTSTQPCESCEHLGRCMDSLWNESARYGGPGKEAPISFVHTCLTCGEQALSVLDDTQHRIVPEGCFRWHPMSGSALDCSGCMEEKRQLRMSHPAYERRSEAALSMFKCLMSGKPEVLAEAAASFSEFSLDYLPLELLPKADSILQRILEDMGKRFGEAWAELDEVQQETHLATWLEQLCLSLGRHPGDAVAVAHEFLLVFNDRPPFSRAWRDLPVTHRKWVKQVWEGMVRRGLQAA